MDIQQDIMVLTILFLKEWTRLVVKNYGKLDEQYTFCWKPNVCTPSPIMDAVLVLSNGNPPWPLDLPSVSGQNVLYRHAQHHLLALFR